MGYTPTFNGQDYHNKKVYGSEITSIKFPPSNNLEGGFFYFFPFCINCCIR